MKFFFASLKSLNKGVGSVVGSISAPKCQGSPTLIYNPEDHRIIGSGGPARRHPDPDPAGPEEPDPAHPPLPPPSRLRPCRRAHQPAPGGQFHPVFSPAVFRQQRDVLLADLVTSRAGELYCHSGELVSAVGQPACPGQAEGTRAQSQEGEERVKRTMNTN
jgi:hypothetical protein